jgi:hypothetical protein
MGVLIPETIATTEKIRRTLLTDMAKIWNDVFSQLAPGF